MQRLFISYSRKDIDFVRKLAGDLEKAGYDVWWDITDLRGGDDWVRMIPSAIESSDRVIVVLSPNSIISEWVEKEYTQALSLHKKIIPIMLAACNVPFALNTINYVNFSLGEYVDNFKNLLTALGFTGEPPTVKPFEPSTLFRSIQTRKFVIPLAAGFVALLFLAWTVQPKPVVQPTATATPLPSTTPTATEKPVTLTASKTATPPLTASPTFTTTATETVTPRPTSTVIPTEPTFITLIYCVNSLYAYAINVRSGPGTNYAPVGEPLLVGKCLTFSAQNEERTWLQVSPNQSDLIFQQYEGGWIARDLLGLGTIGSIDLRVVTLTPTPLPSETPTITPTFTSTLTIAFTSTNTETPSASETPTP